MEDNNKSVIFAVIAVIVLIAGGLGIYALTQNDDEDNDTVQVQQEDQVEIEEEAVTEPNIAELAQATPDLSTLVTAVVAADLVDTLSGPGPFTVLAPTNEAFAALPDGTLDSLLLPENQADLQNVLTYHVIAGEVFAEDLSDGQVVTTVQGENLTVSITEEGVFFVDANGGRAQVTTADVVASNGVVHIINAVLLP